jgi:hypothetical protein
MAIFQSTTLLGWSITLSAIALVAHPSRAVDHNNIEAGHPLSFDDAESIALGEQAIEVSIRTIFPEGQTTGGELVLEYLNGFALNSHFSLALKGSAGGRTGTDNTNPELDVIEGSFFHNFNREYDNVPAFAIRTDAAIATGSEAEGVDFRLRGIASKTVGQYGRLSLNLDLEGKTESESGERSVIPGVILGYSRPLGYPERFDRTFLAELGASLAENTDNGVVILTGVGWRQQVGYRNVLDLGIEGRMATQGSESQLRLIMGYSGAF